MSRFKTHDILFHPDIQIESINLLVIDLALELNDGTEIYIVDFGGTQSLLLDSDIGPRAVKIGEL